MCPAMAQDQPAAAAAPAQAAPAAPAGPAPGTVSYSGLLDWYFLVNPRSPAAYPWIVTPGGQVIKANNLFRAFDLNNSQPTLSLGELDISRTAGHGFPLGFTASITVGDTAQLVHANEPGGSGWNSIQQLYATYTPHLAGRDIPIDFGIFVTPFGYEVIQSNANDNYSRSFLFTYAVPLYHAGIRATIPLTGNLSLLAGVTNGWNNIADDNNAKSLMAQFTYNASSRITGILGWMGGSEGTGAYGTALVPNQTAGDISTNIVDGQIIYKPTDKLKFAGDAVYGRGAGWTTPMGAGSLAPNGYASGSWVGLAGYARYQATPKLGIAARLEQFEDIPGNGSAVGIRLDQAGYQKLTSATLTIEYPILHDKLLSRIEYRHDHSVNAALFGVGNGGAFGNDQDTITFAQVYKF
jgi:hypothetical protein